MTFPVRAVTVAALAVFLIAGRAAAEVCVETDVRLTGLPFNRVALDSMMTEAAAIWAAYGVAIRQTDEAK